MVWPTINVYVMMKKCKVENNEAIALLNKEKKKKFTFLSSVCRSETETVSVWKYSFASGVHDRLTVFPFLESILLFLQKKIIFSWSPARVAAFYFRFEFRCYQ